MREVYSDGAIVQGGLDGVCVHNTIVHSHGSRSSGSSLWDEQRHHDGFHGPGHPPQSDREPISLGFEDILCSDVGLVRTLSKSALTD